MRPSDIRKGLRDLLRSAQSDGFVRNVLTVIAGSGAAIGVNVLVAPILTRLYTPEEFGPFAAFVAVSAIIAVGAQGRYELSIVLAETRREARRLVGLCVGLALLIGLLLFGVAMGGENLLVRFGLDVGLLLWLVPPFVMLLSAGQAFNNWLNWNESYLPLGYNRTFRNLGTGGAQIGLATGSGGALGLGLGRVFGEVVFVALAARIFAKETAFDRADFRWPDLKQLLVKYVRFPTYTLPSSWANTATSQLPEILLLALFSPRAAGLYALTARVVDRPLSFVSDSVKEVFYRKFAASQREGARLDALIKKTVLGMTAVVVPPILVFALFAPSIIVIVFGSDWREAGSYIRVLAPAIAVHLIVRSTGLSMYALNKHHVVLIWTVVFLLLTTTGLLIGSRLGGPLLAVGLLAGVRILMYVIYFTLNLRYASLADEGDNYL